MPVTDPASQVEPWPARGNFRHFGDHNPQDFWSKGVTCLKNKHGAYAYRSVQCRWRGFGSGPIPGPVPPIEASWYRMLGGEHLWPKEGRMSAEFIGRIPLALESRAQPAAQGC